MYEPVPPDGYAVQVAEPPVVMEVGETEQVAVSGGLLTVREFPQETVLVCEPEVTVTDAVLVPVLLYVLVTELPDPERLSVPLQE